MSPPPKEKKRITAREFATAVRGPYRRLFEFMKPYKKRFIIGLICGAIYGGLNGLMIYGLNRVTGEVLPKEDPEGRGGSSVVESWHPSRELPELRAALASLPEIEREAAIRSYADFREHLHDRTLQPPAEGQPDPLDTLTIHPSLPAEFRLCLEGERAMVKQPLTTSSSAASGGMGIDLPGGKSEFVETARGHWQALLELPPEQRRHRTVWARYLLAHTETDKSNRSEMIRRLHADAAGGFTDVLNLVALAPESPAIGAIILVCLIIPALMVLRAFFGFLNAYFLTWVSLRLLNDIRGNLFQRILGQSMEFFNKQKSGDLIQTILNQTRIVQETLSTVAGYIVKEPFSIISALAVLFYIDAKFTLLALIIFPLLIVPVSSISRKVRRHAAIEEQEAGNMSVIMQEALAGVREVKSYNREPYESGRFKAANWRMLSSMLRWRKALEITGPAVEVMASFGIAGALIYVWKLEMPASKFIALNGGFVLLYPPAKALSKIPILLQRSLASTTTIFELMDREISVRDAPEAKPIPQPVSGSITMENVTFAYNLVDAPALRDVSLTISPRETVAFVGRSGAGKSTIFSLLLRLYDPVSGRLLLDGQDIRSVTQESLRAQIGVVSQDVFLFHDTIYENIRYGRLEATEAEIHEAARRAHAHDFILQQPQGYQTVIGDKGSLLSGGQRQRISIARAFLKNAPVLLLDEATSALDPEAERHIQDAIRDLSEGKTVLAIAHRLSTVIKSDRIVVMQDGGIVAAGRHEELLQSCDLYRSLYSMQFHAAE